MQHMDTLKFTFPPNIVKVIILSSFTNHMDRGRCAKTWAHEMYYPQVTTAGRVLQDYVLQCTRDWISFDQVQQSS